MEAVDVLKKYLLDNGYIIAYLMLFGCPPSTRTGKRTVHITEDGGRTWINTGRRTW